MLPTSAGIISTMFRCVGVYICRCLANGKVYVGSSIRCLVRIKEHSDALRRGKHGNKHLQAAYNKYGSDSFKWEILERNPENRFAAEQKWIEKYDASNRRFGYNRSYPVRVNHPNPNMSLKIKNKWCEGEYRKTVEAALLKGSRAVSELYATDPVFVEKMSTIRKGQWKPETRKRLAKQAEKRYEDETYKSQHLMFLESGRQKLAEKRKDPAFVTNQVKGMVDRWKDPEARKKQAARMAALWQNKEFKAKQIEAARARIIAYNKSRADNKR